MRFWLRRGRAPAAAPPSSVPPVTEDLLRENVDDLLVVRDRVTRGGVVSFRGELLVPPARARDVLSERFRAFGYTPFLRSDGHGVVVQAWPLADTTGPQRLGVTTLVFLLKCASTLIAGLGYRDASSFHALRAHLVARP